MKHPLICVFIFFLFSFCFAERNLYSQWRVLSTLPEADSIRTIYFLDAENTPQIGFAVGKNIWRTTDRGNTWSKIIKVNTLVIRDQNKAYFAVAGQGIFEASNKWKNFNLIFPVADATVFAVLNDQIVANIDGVLSISGNGGVDFSPARGIAVTDTITAAEFYSSKTILAVTGKKLYRSLDGGGNWSVVFPYPRKINSIYADRSHRLVYLGGERLLKSLDSGATWKNVNSLFFDSLPGAVLGARDCSGVFYIGPDALTHGSELLRSVDQARFFSGCRTFDVLIYPFA